GDGGDELLGGYNRYISGQRLLANVERIPRGARRLAAMGLGALSPESWSKVYGALTSAFGRDGEHRLVGEKFGKVETLLRMDSFPDRYRSLMSAWQAPETLIPGTVGRPTMLDQILRSGEPSQPLDRMMLGDQLTYLPDDLLAKVDRASMATSLEVRVPLLDHRLAELAWRLPDHFKIRGKTGKWALRQVAYRRIPNKLLDRPKMGFTVPIDRWLQGPLKPWADDLIHSETGSAYLDQPALVEGWRRYQETGHGGLRFWAALMLLGWTDRWGTHVPDPTPMTV
ncbi:MAG: asparagine synthase-related protein, partial [Longimicrobiales bacterium]